jgi:hypothetical protein
MQDCEPLRNPDKVQPTSILTECLSCAISSPRPRR